MGPEETYVALDLETTGLRAKEDKVIEIGAVLVERGEMRDAFSTFVNPRRKLPPKIVEMTGITQEDVDGAPVLEELLTPLSDFIGDRALLGHCILFDYSFLKRAFVNAGMAFEKKGIDTLKLARKYLPDLPSKRLPDLCAHYGIDRWAHRALEDAAAAHLVYERLKRDCYEKREGGEENGFSEKDFRPQQLIYKVKREAAAGKRQKERLLALLERHRLEIAVDPDSMTKNEISRLTDRIVAKYGR